MSWLQNLYQTYENCQGSIGYSGNEKQRPLLPICHITTQAHIEVVIDHEGNFRRASVVTKDKATTIIPCTEGSGSRGGIQPEEHPLCDKLQYVAGDFIKYGGNVTVGYLRDPEKPSNNYIETLSQWCASPFAHPKAHAVLKYVKKKSLIQDLVEHQILFVGKDGKFLSKGEINREKNKIDIFSFVDPQENAFVRWIVEEPGVPESRVWMDKTLWESWKNYYLNNRTDKSLCYATGENQVISRNHPKYIRREGDGAKIISANDSNGYTFRGRFINNEQACGVGVEVSQKAHFALSWLISRQGYVKGDLAIVAWALSGAPVPQPTDDPITLLFGDTPSDEDPQSYTAQEIAVQLRNRIAGYGRKMDVREKVTVMALDSATPGRLSITYYNELSGPDFLKRIETWHTTCAWLHRYREVQDRESGKKRIVPFIGAPAPTDIAEAAYGIRVDDKLRKATISRLLPCIVDGLPIPRDLVESTIRRASNRAGLNNWDWEKTLSIACALFKKYKERKESFDMPLDETRNSRDYLYGRLLAIADVLEERALYKNEQKRATNAARYMQQFSQSPFRTWKQIHDSLAPSILRLGGAHYYKNLIAEVESLFDPVDFISNKALTGEYLLGYYCQRQKLFEKNDKSASEKIESTEEK
jgi:CRISPR-associated protein Csd1